MKNIKLIIMSLLVVSIAFTAKDEGLSKAQKEEMEMAIQAAAATNPGNITAGLAGIGAGLVVLGAVLVLEEFLVLQQKRQLDSLKQQMKSEVPLTCLYSF